MAFSASQRIASISIQATVSRSAKNNSSGPLPDAVVSLVQRLNPRSFGRYAIVGLVQNAAFYGLALLLIWHGWFAWQASALLTPIAIATTFVANRSWTFSGHSRVPGQFPRYVAVYSLAYAFTVGFNWLQEASGVPSWLAALISIGVTAVGIYLALNFWVFRRAPTPLPVPD